MSPERPDRYDAFVTMNFDRGSLSPTKQAISTQEEIIAKHRPVARIMFTYRH